MTERATKPLAPERAFVLQLTASREGLVGRVEHVVSGRAARFRTADELTAFARRVLEAVQDERPSAPSDSLRLPSRDRS